MFLKVDGVCCLSFSSLACAVKGSTEDRDAQTLAAFSICDRSGAVLQTGSFRIGVADDRASRTVR